MPERSDAPEGWGVRQRLPVLVALGTVTTLVLLLVIAALFYDHTLKPETRGAYSTLPAPGVETAIHDGESDPHLAPAPAPADPRIAAAKREVVANGLPGWGARK